MDECEAVPFRLASNREQTDIHPMWPPGVLPKKPDSRDPLVHAEDCNSQTNRKRGIHTNWSSEHNVESSFKFTRREMGPELQDGQCTVELADKSVYTGELKNKRFHGRGKLVQANGDFYEGQWAEGRKHGIGVLFLSSGHLYEGSWYKGSKHGYGKEIWEDGSKYEGQYIEGKRDGQGTFTDEKENTYSGSFLQDKMSGFVSLH